MNWVKHLLQVVIDSYVDSLKAAHPQRHISQTEQALIEETISVCSEVLNMTITSCSGSLLGLSEKQILAIIAHLNQQTQPQNGSPFFTSDEIAYFCQFMLVAVICHAKKESEASAIRFPFAAIATKPELAKIVTVENLDQLEETFLKALDYRFPDFQQDNVNTLDLLNVADTKSLASMVVQFTISGSYLDYDDSTLTAINTILERKQVQPLPTRRATSMKARELIEQAAASLAQLPKKSGYLALDIIFKCMESLDEPGEMTAYQQLAANMEKMAALIKSTQIHDPVSFISLTLKQHENVFEADASGKLMALLVNAFPQDSWQDILSLYRSHIDHPHRFTACLLAIIELQDISERAVAIETVKDHLQHIDATIDGITAARLLSFYPLSAWEIQAAKLNFNQVKNVRQLNEIIQTIIDICPDVPGEYITRLFDPSAHSARRLTYLRAGMRPPEMDKSDYFIACREHQKVSETFLTEKLTEGREWWHLKLATALGKYPEKCTSFFAKLPAPIFSSVLNKLQPILFGLIEPAEIAYVIGRLIETGYEYGISNPHSALQLQIKLVPSNKLLGMLTNIPLDYFNHILHLIDPKTLISALKTNRRTKALIQFKGKQLACLLDYFHKQDLDSKKAAVTELVTTPEQLRSLCEAPFSIQEIEQHISMISAEIITQLLDIDESPRKTIELFPYSMRDLLLDHFIRKRLRGPNATLDFLTARQKHHGIDLLRAANVTQLRAMLLPNGKSFTDLSSFIDQQSPHIKSLAGLISSLQLLELACRLIKLEYNNSTAGKKLAGQDHRLYQSVDNVTLTDMDQAIAQIMNLKPLEIATISLQIPTVFIHMLEQYNQLLKDFQHYRQDASRMPC